MKKRKIKLVAPVLTTRGPGAVVQDCHESGEAGETWLSMPLRPDEAAPPGLEVVRARPIDGEHFECETIVDPSDYGIHADHAGPARVSTEQYRSGWERVFGEGDSVATRAN